LANTTCAMDERLVKPARVRLVRLLIAEMPFAKNAAGVTGLLQHLRQDGRLERHSFTLEDGVGYPILHRVPTGHDGTTRGRTRGADKKPREACAGVIKLIKIWRANPWMPVPANRAVALIIGDDQNNIWLLGLRLV